MHTSDRKFSVEQAAKIMGVSPMFLRLGLRRGEFPFGVAIKFEKQWRYYINRAVPPVDDRRGHGPGGEVSAEC